MQIKTSLGLKFDFTTPKKKLHASKLRNMSGICRTYIKINRLFANALLLDCPPPLPLGFAYIRPSF